MIRPEGVPLVAVRAHADCGLRVAHVKVRRPVEDGRRKRKPPRDRVRDQQVCNIAKRLAAATDEVEQDQLIAMLTAISNKRPASVDLLSNESAAIEVHPTCLTVHHPQQRELPKDMLTTLNIGDLLDVLSEPDVGDAFSTSDENDLVDSFFAAQSVDLDDHIEECAQRFMCITPEHSITRSSWSSPIAERPRKRPCLEREGWKGLPSSTKFHFDAESTSGVAAVCASPTPMPLYTL